MKKITLFAVLFATLCGVSAYAQDNEPQLVEQSEQGYLFNRFKDNWFIHAEGGVGFWTAPNAIERDIMDRWSPAAGLYVGKRFSPIIAARIGANWLQAKGLSTVAINGVEYEKNMIVTNDQEYYRQKFSHVGPVFDMMINLTNWWCGYKPGRKFNSEFYLGGGAYWTLVKDYKANINTPVANNIAGYAEDFKKDGWKDAHDRVTTFRAGLINSFNLSKQVRISLDLRASAIDNHPNEENVDAWNKTAYDFQAYLGLTYLFKKREWSPAVCPVCPEPENCDPVRRRLEEAEARIADLEAQLKACLERPVEVVEVEKTVEEKAPLATIYYPINVYTLTQKDVNVLRAVSNVMKENSDKKYVLTGWADNYTGNDVINTRLRKNRVAGVEKQLIKEGVPAKQLRSTINANNLVDLGEKYQALGRAVTIEEDE